MVFTLKNKKVSDLSQKKNEKNKKRGNKRKKTEGRGRELSVVELRSCPTSEPGLVRQAAALLRPEVAHGDLTATAQQAGSTPGQE